MASKEEGLMLWVEGQGDRGDGKLQALYEALAKIAPIQRVLEDEVSRYLNRSTAEGIAGVVISPHTAGPLTAARRILARLPDREVIFVGAEGDESADRRRQVELFLRFGHHRLIEREDVEETVEVVDRLLRQARTRRRFRSVLTRINEQLQTSRREMAIRRRLAISDRLLASMLDQSPDSLLALDLDGYVIAGNSALQRTFGVNDELEGALFEETPIAATLPQLVEFVEEVRAGGGTCTREVSFEGAQREAGITDLEVSATPVVDERGDVIGITLLLRDVSRLKKAERDLRRLNRDLEQRVADQTRELREANANMEAFLYSVAHDLRAPVRSIRSFTEIVLEDHDKHLPDEAKSFLKRVFKAAGRMDFLIRDLLTYSRVATADLVLGRVDLNQVLSTARTALQHEIEERRAEISVDDQLGTVPAHRTTLEQAIINLLSNALRYSKPDQPPSVHVYSRRKEGRLRLFMEDNGIGIDPEYHTRIFRVFERLETRLDAPGTGVGLAIVKVGIERLGGRVGVESVPGEGSRFWIELPTDARAEAGGG